MERLEGISMLDEETISRVVSDPQVGQEAIITALNIWTESVMKMPWFHADVHAGNLLLLDDGRVGFIDFGIVGRVSDNTFQAVNELSTALAVADYKGMAEALCKMGATDEQVDTDKFGRDIEMVMGRIANIQPDVTVAEMSDGSVAGAINFDESEITNILLEVRMTRLLGEHIYLSTMSTNPAIKPYTLLFPLQLVDVTEENGLKLPREFGLLVKQSLYFDRYLKILAPGLDVMSDSRVSGLGQSPQLKNQEVLIDV